MAKLTILPAASYDASTRSVTALAIPLGARRLRIEWDVTNMTDPAMGIAVAAEISRDDGKTWKPLVAFRFAGGPIKNIATRMDGPPFFSVIDVALPSPDSSARKVRGTITLSGGPRLQSGTLELR